MQLPSKHFPLQFSINFIVKNFSAKLGIILMKWLSGAMVDPIEPPDRR